MKINALIHVGSECIDAVEKYLEKRETRGYPMDEESPFFSESYLYPLMGKEDARTVLAMLKTTFRMLEALLGKPFPMRAIY